jgi:hypothetical protein
MTWLGIHDPGAVKQALRLTFRVLSGLIHDDRLKAVPVLFRWMSLC